MKFRIPLFFLAVLGVLVASGASARTAPGDVLFANGFEVPVPATAGGGGVNYLWFGDDGQCRDDSRDAYGLLKRYHETDAELGPVRALAQSQLATMRARGMRRLSLGVYFMHQPAAGGTLVDSSDPAAVAQAASNLALLLADAKAAGFVTVLFRFFPTNNINPSQPEFPGEGSPDYSPRVDEYWRLIEALRPVLAASGIGYRIDLMVEGAPRDSNNTLYPENQRYKYPANSTWSRTVRTLWQRYVAARDAAAPWASRSRPIRTTTGCARACATCATCTRACTRRCSRWISTPAARGTSTTSSSRWTNTCATRIRPVPAGTAPAGSSPRRTTRIRWRPMRWRARSATPGTVFYLTQWPLDRAGQCRNPHVNVVPPYEWMVWPGFGF